jgi:hypothetical protein
MKKLHLEGARRGISHDDLRAIAVSLFRLPADKQSLSSLSNSQVGALIGHICNPGTVTIVRGSITDRQKWLIQQLVNELGWSGNPERLAGFMARQCRGKRDVADLHVPEASRLIEGLKHLLLEPAKQ